MRRAPALRAALAVGLAVAVLAVVGFVLHPAVRATAKSVFVLDGAFDGPLPRPWAPSVERSEQEMGGVVVDRYSPNADVPPILLVPGATPAGRDDQRVVSLASSLAAAGREVVVPELSLYEEEIDVVDVGRVVEVAAELCPRGGGLVLFGFSYGGSLALVAAADERVAGCIDLVATFGAYADLVGVLQAAATGVSVVNGKVYPWHAADESIVRTVLQDAATKLVPEEDREPLRRALEQEDPRGLSDAARRVYRMVTTDDPALVADLARRLPPPGDALVETFSPAAVADRIEADVLAVHALDDPAVPFAELLRLHAAFPQAEVMTVRSFRHVDLTTDDGLGPLVTDLLTAGAFMQAVLRPQEEWPWE
ncbi:MAG TPA: alpha/beta fold hydrolase [Geodermatophilus sp.]|nr:alpha/beta fold hydrolase [Geodermatophilus sp.]